MKPNPNLESKKYLSGACVIANYDKQLFFVELPLSQDIKDLITTAKEKLKICKRILLDYKKDLKFYFSKDDLRILLTLDSMKLKYSNFYSNLQNNLVTYNSETLKVIDILINSNELKLNDRNRYKTLTKWYDLNPESSGESKLKTILNNQLYAGFTNGFNDVFDSRINCYEGTINKLAIKYIHDKFVVNSKKQLSLDMKKTFIQYYQAYFNSANADCFSLCDPTSFESHNMWGLYCKSRYGVSIEYNINEYLASLEKSMPDIEAIMLTAMGKVDNFEDLAIKLQASSIDSSLKTRLLKINYKERFNPFELFEKYVRLVSERLNNQLLANSAVNDVLQDFYSSKNIQWMFEKEIRFLNFDYSYRSCFNTNHPLNMKYFINNYDKAVLEISQFEKSFLNNPKNRIKFIKPSKIILKWDCDENTEIIKKLILYARKLKIPVMKLSSDIDYYKDEFRYTKLKI